MDALKLGHRDDLQIEDTKSGATETEKERGRIENNGSCYDDTRRFGCIFTLFWTDQCQIHENIVYNMNEEKSF